jgi:hypothetical protein
MGEVLRHSIPAKLLDYASLMYYTIHGSVAQRCLVARAAPHCTPIHHGMAALSGDPQAHAYAHSIGVFLLQAANQAATSAAAAVAEGHLDMAAAMYAAGGYSVANGYSAYGFSAEAYAGYLSSAQQMQ